MFPLASSKKQIKRGEEDNCFGWVCDWDPNNSIIAKAIVEDLYLLKISNCLLFTHLCYQQTF